jgi:hypothetical protein
MPGPVQIQRIEGLVLLAAALILFGQTPVSWWWFAGLLLIPDLSMIGYLANPRTGAFSYNLGHSLVGPGLLFLWFWVNGPVLALALGAIWLAHIGMDRLFGYGLKHDDDFKHTHLGWIGQGTRS